MHNEKQIQRDLDHLFAAPEPQGINCYFGRVDEGAILAAEATIGLSFPPSYRLFLQRFGVAMYCEVSIYGIYPEEAAYDFIRLNVVENTDFLRTSGLLEVLPPHQRCPPIEKAIQLAASDLDNSLDPEQVISIAHDENGVSYYLDYTHLVDGEPPVVAISGYFGPSVAARNFLEFLQILVQSEGSPNPFGLYIQEVN